MRKSDIVVNVSKLSFCVASIVSGCSENSEVIEKLYELISIVRIVWFVSIICDARKGEWRNMVIMVLTTATGL